MKNEKRKTVEILVRANLNILDSEDIDSEKGRAEFTKELRKQLDEIMRKINHRKYAESTYINDVDYELGYNDEGKYEWKKEKSPYCKCCKKRATCITFSQPPPKDGVKDNPPYCYQEEDKDDISA